MKIVHKIFGNWSQDEIGVLEAHGIAVAPGCNAFTLDEQDERYAQLRPQLQAWKVLDSVGTEFAKPELDEARQLVAWPGSQSGYPQPEDDFEYTRITYDDSHYCPRCGVGLCQKAPFRLRSELRWGKRKAFMLHWVLDEIFVERETYERIFRPSKVECIPVVHHRTGSEIASVVQLVIAASTIPLALEHHEFETCESCRRRKFLPITRGFFPPFRGGDAGIELIKSQEYFGSGAQAAHWVVISQAMRGRLEREGVKMTYVPITTASP